MALTLEEKIGQMLGVGFYGLELPAYLQEWLAEGRVGALVLFARNIASPAQLAELTQACHESARFPLLIAIDQEGGTVARLRGAFSESPGAMALSAANSTQLAEAVSKVLAEELLALGINWNLAPVVDLTHDINNASVGTRSLGTDPARVGQLAAAQIQGFQKAGVAATAKHFPGLGRTPVDTHEAAAVIDASIETLKQHDLRPFRAAVEADVASVMISHVRFPAIDPLYPATLSANVVRLLREEVGFGGLIVTDCMEMRAISDHYTPGETAVQAAKAGNDIIFFSHSFTASHKGHADAFNALVDAVRRGNIDMARIEDASRHIADMKARYALHQKPDPGIIGQAAHRAIMEDAARQGVVVIRTGSGLIPLSPEKRIVGIEFASTLESGIMEAGGLTGFASALKAKAPFVEQMTLASPNPAGEQLERALRLVQNSEILILVTRNAHLIPEQMEKARALMNAAQKTILLCLRNPYDANLFTAADSIICTCGDSAPSLQAAAAVLTGEYTPSARLPVPLEISQ